MNFSPKQKLYSVSGGFLIAIILILVAVVFPLLEKIKASNAALEEQKMASENFYQNQKNMAAAKKIAEQIQGELNSLGAFLPKNEALKFIVATEKISQETGNRQSISIAKEPTDKTDKKETALKLQISLSGNFPNLLNFLVRMESAPYFNNLNSLQINRASTKEDSSNKNDNINSAISLSAYYQ